MSGQGHKRAYRAPRREAQAAATRARILGAAEDLFVRRGYAATTLAQIGTAAGVALPTVTTRFGTKLALLEALIATTVRGDEAAIPLRERDWWQAALADPDPHQMLARYAGNIRRIHERTTDIFEIVRGAATADPTMAELRHQLACSRLLDCREVALALAAKGVLTPELRDDAATDAIWGLVSAELYRLLVIERGWAPARYQQWLTRTLATSLLA